MNPSDTVSAPKKRHGLQAIFVLLVAAAVAAALVHAVRVASWYDCWRWTITEGREGQTIYGIWRVVHGQALYTWPNEEPYGLMYLNFGFYWAYAAIARALSADGEDLLWLCRLLTTLGSVVGTLLFVSTAKLLAPPRARLEWLALGALAFVVWFGTQFIAWWTLSIRPDVWAAVFALAGLRLALPALATRAVGRLTAASLLFFLAWSFKQSCLLSFIGCCLSAVIVARSVRALVALAAPFAFLVGVSLALGGELYRFNIVTVPAASEWHLGLMTEVLGRALPQNPWVFGFFPLWLWAERKRRGWSTLPSAVQTLTIVIAVSVAFGSAALGREGSNKNHLFEGYITSALAAAWALQQIARSNDLPRGLIALGGILLFPLVAFPVVQLAVPNRLGRTVLCTQNDGAELERLAGQIERLPKPLYTEHEIFAQPWHSSGKDFPAVVIDPTLHAIAKREGLVFADFPMRLFALPRFRTVMQTKDHPDVSTLRERGWPCHELTGRPSGLEFVACSVPASPR